MNSTHSDRKASITALTKLLESNDWNGKLVVSPDVDGVVSANLISHIFDAELIGFYDPGSTSVLRLCEGYDWSDAESALWLDHDIIDSRIISVGQHMIHPYAHSTTDLEGFEDRPDLFEYDRRSNFQRNQQSFNPHDIGRFGWDHPRTFPRCNQQDCEGIALSNETSCRRHGGSWTLGDWDKIRGFRRKYPFATIHLLLAALQHHELNITPRAELLIAHSDSAWLAATQNANNAEWWLRNVLHSEPNARSIAGTLPQHTTNRETMLQHLRLIWSLDDAAIIDLANERRVQRESEVRELSIYAAGYTMGNKQHLHPRWENGNLDDLSNAISSMTGWNFRAASGSLNIMAEGDSEKLDPKKNPSWEGENFARWLEENRVFSLAFTGMDTLRFTTNMTIL